MAMSWKKRCVILVSVCAWAMLLVAAWLYWLDSLDIIVLDKHTGERIQTIKMKVLYQADGDWKAKSITIWNTGQGVFRGKLKYKPEIFIVPAHVSYNYKPLIIHRKIPWYQKTLYIYCDRISETGTLKGRIVDIDNKPLEGIYLQIQYKYPMDDFLKKVNDQTRLIFDPQKVDMFGCATSLGVLTDSDGVFECRVPLGHWYLFGIPEVRPVMVYANKATDIGTIKIGSSKYNSNFLWSKSIFLNTFDSQENKEDLREIIYPVANQSMECNPGKIKTQEHCPAKEANGGVPVK